MRGLTAEERACLSDEKEATEHEWEVVCPMLAAQGRLRHRFYHAEMTERYINTDLGNLALRVCPIDGQ